MHPIPFYTSHTHTYTQSFLQNYVRFEILGYLVKMNKLGVFKKRWGRGDSLAKVVLTPLASLQHLGQHS